VTSDTSEVRPSAGIDISAAFVVAFAAGPFLLPLLGVDVGDLAFVLPTAVLVWASVRTTAAAGRAPARRVMWISFAVATACAAAASGIAFVSSIADVSLNAAFSVGIASSLAMLVGSIQVARHSLREARPEQLFDSLLVGLLLVALGVFYVAVPGFDRGDTILTLVFVADVVALLVAMPAAGSLDWRLGTPIVATVMFAACGDALVAAAAADQIAASPIATAALWTAAGTAIAVAAGNDRGAADIGRAPDPAVRFPYVRALFPLPAVLAFAGFGVLEVLVDGPAFLPIAYFGTFFLIALGLGFARQAYLVVANRRTAAKEREVRAIATRRNEDLEALTGLAATMTESFEEEAIIDRGLEVLRLGARATSAGLYVADGAGLTLRAITGQWQAEAPWIEVPDSLDDVEPIVERASRLILRLPVVRRDSRLGLVTLVRPAADRFDDEELALLRLLVAQLAIGLQNARDYRERLDQAIRDPLTGLYNRRFVLEALAKEIHRQGREGSPVSLVLFDLDDFKRINDRHGHAVGDEVLCRLGRIAQGEVRSMDSFARLGGEEFALLLPATSQLDALLVAERIRSAVAREELAPGVTVRVSAGIASCPGDGSSVDELHKQADNALYWAKRNGKNMCALARDTSSTESSDDAEPAVANLYSLVDMIDRRLRTLDHSENVANYAAQLGRSFGLSAETIVRLRRAALLHDVGKVAVTSEILGKPGALSDAEYAEIKRHPSVGSVILAHAGLATEARWVRHHHERIDGRGYPDGLRGEEIPIEARILFVADAFEAMTSDRPYRRGSSVDEAIEELRRSAGTQFDSQVVARLTELVAVGEVQVAPLRAAGAVA
jgi:diguanylate cyclase (GGDEF)-like protein